MQQSSSPANLKTPRNEMHGLRNLMRQWHRESPATAEVRPPSPSPSGNIDDEGAPVLSIHNTDEISSKIDLWSLDNAASAFYAAR
jgi:hypothetical protein